MEESGAGTGAQREGVRGARTGLWEACMWPSPRGAQGSKGHLVGLRQVAPTTLQLRWTTWRSWSPQPRKCWGN